MITHFTSLDNEKKIEICNKSQNILAEHFPTSEYTLNKSNLKNGIAFYTKMIDTFDGNVFCNDEAVVFYKLVHLENPHDRDGEFKRIIKEPHHEWGNCMFVEFFAANITPDTIGDLEKFFFSNSNIEYLMALRRGVIYIKPMNDLRVVCSRINGSLAFINGLMG